MHLCAFYFFIDITILHVIIYFHICKSRPTTLYTFECQQISSSKLFLYMINAQTVHNSANTQCNNTQWHSIGYRLWTMQY